ncbi:MAG: hypothetical protein ACM3SX_10715 [Deltaproteobacteria bacterium]
MRPYQRAVVRLLAAVAAASAGNPLGAQLSLPAQSAPSTTVATDPFVDLWFHCLALVGYEGYGQLALYDHQYAARVRADKRRAAVATTLDIRADELHAGFTRDSAFEVLHFVPLYFVGREPRLALSELRRAVESPGNPTTTAARLVAAAMATPRERALFLAFIDGAEQEWSTYLREQQSRQAATDNRKLFELQTAWHQQFAARLSKYFVAMHLARVIIIVSPAVGSDGRFIRDAHGSAIIVVSSNRADMAEAPLLASVRELAYPLLDRLQSPPATAATRDGAAVRAGAMMLDAADSQLAAAYRGHFLKLTSAPTFDSAFPIDRRVEVGLRELIAATFQDAALGRSSYENR